VEAIKGGVGVRRRAPGECHRLGVTPIRRQRLEWQADGADGLKNAAAEKLISQLLDALVRLARTLRRGTE
jgi:hypothetical protein